MVQMVGRYRHERNENLDAYFAAVGVPYIPRKMMCATSPTLEVKQENDVWNITTSTLLRTITYKFKLGEEYEENMPGGTLKSTTVLDGNTLRTSSIGPNNSKVSRIYDFNDDGCVITYKHEESGTEAKRYFRRA